MRKFLILAAFVLAAAVSGTAQTYDSGHKYGLFSNLEIGVAGGYSHGLGETKGQNFGAELLITKRIGDYWRIRSVAEVNGFIKNGHDRYGKGMLGMSFDLLPFCIFFADYGVAYNPSAASRFGLAMDCGIGLQFKVGGGSLYTEAAVDRVNSGTAWQSNASVKVGYLASLGITERDRVAISIDNNMRSEYGNLKGENQLLKSEAKKMQETNEQMQATLTEATAVLQELKLQLAQCNTEKKEIADNCGKDPLQQPILFEYAEAFLRPAAYETVEDIADAIINGDPNATYSINGYCSNNGDIYTNQKLSEARAWAVFYALEALGVDSTRMFIVGHGMSDKDSAREQKVVVKKSL